MRFLPISLVRERRDFRLLFVATLGSSLGTWLAFIALVVDVYDRTESATWVGALLLAEFVPIVLLGLFAAPFVDRLPRRSILIASDIARAAIFLVLPFAGSASQIVVLALLAGVATSFFRPAAYAGLPNLVPEEELPRANGRKNGSAASTLSAATNLRRSRQWLQLRAMRSMPCAPGSMLWKRSPSSGRRPRTENRSLSTAFRAAILEVRRLIAERGGNGRNSYGRRARNPDRYARKLVRSAWLES
jgi:hypothetical protein